MSPNNILRDLSIARLTAPEVPLVALGGDSILFDGLTGMLDQFVRFVRSSEKTAEDKRYWGIDVLRACILLLGDGINFAFIEGAFSSAIDEDAEEEAQTLLDAFEAAQPPGIYDDDDEGSSDNDDDDEEDGDVEVEVEDEDEDEGGIVLTIGRNRDDEDDDDEDDDNVPFVFFPTRRSGLNYPERHAAEDVPIVSHRKAYSGHCNVQTVRHILIKYLICRLKMSIITAWMMNTSCLDLTMEFSSFVLPPYIFLTCRGPENIRHSTVVKGRQLRNQRHDRSSLLSPPRNLRNRLHSQNLLPRRSR